MHSNFRCVVYTWSYKTTRQHECGVLQWSRTLREKILQSHWMNLTHDQTTSDEIMSTEWKEARPKIINHRIQTTCCFPCHGKRLRSVVFPVLQFSDSVWDEALYVQQQADDLVDWSTMYNKQSASSHDQLFIGINHRWKMRRQLTDHLGNPTQWTLHLLSSLYLQSVVWDRVPEGIILFLEIPEFSFNTAGYS